MVYAYIIADSDIAPKAVSKIVNDTVHIKFKGAKMKECTRLSQSNEYSIAYKATFYTQNDNRFNEWMFHGFRFELEDKFANKIDVKEVGILKRMSYERG